MFNLSFKTMLSILKSFIIYVYFNMSIIKSFLKRTYQTLYVYLESNTAWTNRNAGRRICILIGSCEEQARVKNNRRHCYLSQDSHIERTCLNPTKYTPATRYWHMDEYYSSLIWTTRLFYWNPHVKNWDKH